jgi:hypothetical protein
VITSPAHPDARYISNENHFFGPIQAPGGVTDSDELFRQLVLDHRQRLYRFVVKRIGWATDAEDLTQQAFVEAAQSYSTFRGASELSTWLYPAGSPGRIQMAAVFSNACVQITLTDQAPAFDPIRFPDPDTTLSIEDRQIGGLGLLFVKRMADSVAYRRVHGTDLPASNELTFTKRIAPTGAGADA